MPNIKNLETLVLGAPIELKYIESLGGLKNLFLKNAKKKDIDLIKENFPNLNLSLPSIFHAYL